MSSAIAREQSSADSWVPSVERRARRSVGSGATKAIHDTEK